jgi:hypothetical protein
LQLAASDAWALSSNHNKQVGNLSTLTKNSGSFLLEFPFSRRGAKI